MAEGVINIEQLRKIPMVFIVGFGRSGTSLLQELMNAHPHIIGPPEYSFIIYLYPRFGNKKNWSKQDVLDFVDALYYRPVFSLWNINRQQLNEKLLSIAGEADYPLMCKTVFHQMANGKENIMVFCDKNPENSLFIETLLKVFPNARFLHMVRDPRDNVNSQNKSFRKKNIYLIAQRWLGYNKAIEKVKQRMPEKFYTVFYEKLVTNTEATMRAVCEFLKVPYSEEMIENRFKDRVKTIEQNPFADRMKNLHKSLMQPVNTTNIGKWQKEMSPLNVAITETIAGKLAHEKYNYTIGTKHADKIKISRIKLMKSLWYYRLWEIYTRRRYRDYERNKRYYTRKMKSRPMGV